MTNEKAIELIDERMCFGRGKWSEHHKPEYDVYWEAGEIAINAIRERKEWTPVSKGNPHRNGRYLVTIQDIKVPTILDVVECDYWIKEGWYGFPGRVGQLGDFVVIAWRLLDEPYKPEGESK